MNELSHLAQSAPSVWISILLTIIGMLIYWSFIIQKAKHKLGRTFFLQLWWYDNVLDVGISILAAVGVFIASYSAGTLTMERCLFMGIAVSFFCNKLKRMIQ